MLIVNFSFDVKASSGETLAVSALDPLPVGVTNTDVKVRRVSVRNHLSRAVSLTGFATVLEGVEAEHAMVAIVDPSPFEIPANSSRMARIEITALQTWRKRVSILARVSARETPSAA